MFYQSKTSAALLAGVALAAITQAQDVAAQQSGDVTTLAPIDIQGRGSDGEIRPAGAAGTAPVNGYVPSVTTSGSKTDTPIELIPQSVSVIGREQMDDLGARKFDEALLYSSGVFAQPFGPDSDTNWLYIRGFDATQTGVYRDGLQLYSFGFGGFFTDSYLLERIEVLRGASAALYGSGNAGGIVNLIGKRPTDEPFHKVEVGVDQYPTAYGAFDISDSIGGGTRDANGVYKGDPAAVWKYRFTGKIEGGDGNSKHEDGFRGVFAPVISYEPSADTKITVYGNYQHMDQKHGGGSFLPYYGTVKKTDFGRIDRDENFTEPDLDKYEREQFMLGYEFSHDLNDAWTVQSNVRYAYSHLKEVSLYPFGYNGFALTPQDPDNQLSRINFGHNTKAYSFTADNRVVGKFATGGLDHTLLVGIDYKYYGIDQVQATGTATPISATDPDYGAPQGPRDNVYIDQKGHLNQLGAYIQDQVRFGGGFIATLNGRYDRYWLDAHGLPELKQEKGSFSGRAGLGYEFANGVVPYVSVATFFDPILDAAATKPTEGHQYEAGVKYKPSFFPALFTASVFDLVKQNVLTGPFMAQRQVGEIRSRGFEFEAQANFSENLKFIGSFTAYDLEIRKDADSTLVGEQPYLVPETMASALLDYTFTSGALKGFAMSGGVRYIGKSWADQPNTEKVPAKTLFDASVRYEKDGYGVSLNVTNLLDKRYVTGCQGLYTCSYGEGRKALVKASYTW